jgi:hypothetical protein
MINFYTPGTLDLRCLTTFGVNVKPMTSSPIGYFGTGLKYAIAVLLRHNAQITIRTGDKVYKFFSKKEAIREKDFDLCYYTYSGDADDRGTGNLPFTLELGKNWTLENAYRELYSNTKDEQGRIVQEDSVSFSGSMPTVISISLPAFDEVYANRDSFILSPALKPIHESPDGQIFAFSSQTVFFQGIAACQLDRPSVYTYNITRALTLTEDRTIWSYQADAAVADIVASLTDKATIKSALTQKDRYEHGLRFTYADKSPGFMDAIAQLVKTDSVNLAHGAVDAYHNSAKAPIQWEERPFSASHQHMLDRLIILAEDAGIPLRSYPIVFSTNLGQSILARAYSGKIWLTEQCFSSKTLLLSALLEEYIHLRYGVADETRTMQNAIFALLVEVLLKEPAKEPVPELPF